MTPSYYPDRLGLTLCKTFVEPRKNLDKLIRFSNAEFCEEFHIASLLVKIFCLNKKNCKMCWHYFEKNNHSTKFSKKMADESVAPYG